MQDEAFKAGKTCRKLQFAGRLFFHIGLQHDPVRCAALFLLDFEFFLEIAERLDPVFRTLDLLRIEGITFADTEFAADDLVLRQRVSVHVDLFDIDARCLGDLEGHRHGQIILVAAKLRANIAEGITQRAGGLAQPLNRVFHFLGVVPLALFHGQLFSQPLPVKIAQLAFHHHVAELVAFTFFHHIGDDEIFLVRRQFRDCRHHPEIGITFRQVELAQLLLVIGHAVRVITGAGTEHTEEARLLGDHLVPQVAIGEFLVPDDVDLAHLGFAAFADLENDIDAILLKLDHLGFDLGGIAALALVQLDDAGDIGAHLGPGENLARRQLDLRQDLVILDPLVAFKDDPVDDRVFLHIDHHSAIIFANGDIREQFGGVKILQRLVTARLRIFLPFAQLDVAEDRFRFEPLVAHHGDRADCRNRGFGRRLGRAACFGGRRFLRGCKGGNTRQHRPAQQCDSKTRSAEFLAHAAHIPFNPRLGFIQHSAGHASRLQGQTTHLGTRPQPCAR